MAIETIITGGQSGADQGAWEAAWKRGVGTFGYMPKGYQTEDGPRPEFKKLYGAVESEEATYPARTRMNASECARANGAILCFDASEVGLSRGTKLLCRTHSDLVLGGKTYPELFLVRLELCNFTGGYSIRDEKFNAYKVARKLSESGCTTLMVAGNRESSAYGMRAFVKEYVESLIYWTRKFDDQKSEK